MFRLTLSFLIIVGLFASQVAAVPHAHAGMSAEAQQKHDATPHFHPPRRGHDHHGHSSSHHGHHHKGLDTSAKHSSNPSGSNGLAGWEHNTDAIFVGVNASTPVSQRSISLQYVLIWALQFAVCTTVAQPDLVHDLIRPGHPPDEVCDGSDIYLTLRNLRI